jgi:hypothetical protein
MSEVVPFSNEMIAKLVKAGYLRPEHSNTILTPLRARFACPAMIA